MLVIIIVYLLMPETVSFISYSSHSTPNIKLHHESLSHCFLKNHSVCLDSYSGIFPDHLLCLSAPLFLVFSSSNSWPTPASYPLFRLYGLPLTLHLVWSLVSYVGCFHGLIRDWFLVVILRSHELPLLMRKTLVLHC